MPKNKKCQFKSELYPDYRCTKSPLEGSKFCIFHKPNKTEDEAKSFKDKISKKLQNKDYNFIGYHFPKGVAFKNQVFTKEARFEESTFEGEAFFEDSAFEAAACFDESTFEGYARFHRSTFETRTHFAGSAFKQSANFEESTFKSGNHFEWSVFKGFARFQRSTFHRVTFFEGSIFEGEAFFEDSAFKGWANFHKSIFKGWAHFEGSTFDKEACFEEATFETDAHFTRSIFKGEPVFENVTFRDTSSAEDVFRIAKTCSQTQGDYSLAGEYYYRERIARRKQSPWYKRSLEYILLDGLCGYGERPLRAIRTGLGVLFGLAFLCWKVGHIYPSPELFNEPHHTLTFLDALYFSVVTFTTLGFGDWRPDPSHWIRYIVMAEAFIGAFLMALFIVTFARRMMR